MPSGTSFASIHAAAGISDRGRIHAVVTIAGSFVRIRKWVQKQEAAIFMLLS